VNDELGDSGVETGGGAAGDAGAAPAAGGEAPNAGGRSDSQYDLPLDYTQKQPRKEVQDLLDKVETLDVSTDRDGAIFYSGPENKKLAMQCARETGRKTLEQTPGGEWLKKQNLYENHYEPDNNPKKLTHDEANIVWARLSQRYAEQASGEAFAFIRGAKPEKVFWNTEARVLNQSPSITKVIS
jgi:hypothetical protein